MPAGMFSQWYVIVSPDLVSHTLQYVDGWFCAGAGACVGETGGCDAGGGAGAAGGAGGGAGAAGAARCNETRERSRLSTPTAPSKTSTTVLRNQSLTETRLTTIPSAWSPVAPLVHRDPHDEP